MVRHTAALSSSLEDYLEAILIISNSKGVARSKDISLHLAVKRPSVTGALRLLAEKELVHYAPYDVVTLTDKGRQIAENVIRRHLALRQFLIEVLQLDEEDAETTACQLEHGVSENVIDRLVYFVDFLKVCPRGGFKWIGSLPQNCEHGADKQACECCISKCLEGLKDMKSDEKTVIAEAKLGEQ
jgi:DtxR family Mn-dependent transcriptional regulator